MKDRIRELMLDKGMSQKSFASELCIAEATLSGIFNGRTRPTTLTVNAIHERFPDVNISWLMFGDGDMYTTHPGEKKECDANVDIPESQYEEPDLFSLSSVSETYHHAISQPMAPQSVPNSTAGVVGKGQPIVAPQIQYVEKYIEKPQRKITEIRIFFDDGTYETFTP